MEENKEVPNNFIIFSRKEGEISQEDRAKIFHTINNTIGVFLENYKEEDEEN